MTKDAYGMNANLLLELERARILYPHASFRTPLGVYEICPVSDWVRVEFSPNWLGRLLFRRKYSEWLENKLCFETRYEEESK